MTSSTEIVTDSYEFLDARGAVLRVGSDLNYMFYAEDQGGIQVFPAVVVWLHEDMPADQGGPHVWLWLHGLKKVIAYPLVTIRQFLFLDNGSDVSVEDLVDAQAGLDDEDPEG